MKNYVKEEATDLDEEFLPPLDITSIILEDSQGYVRCNEQYERRWPWKLNSKNVKKTFNDYFTRRPHLKEQLEVVKDNDKEAEA